MKTEKFILQKDSCALLIIDIQEKLFGAMDEAVRTKVARNAGVLAATAKAYSIPVILTEQYPKGLGRTVPEVKDRLSEIAPLEKNYFDCMKEGAIAENLVGLGKRTVIIAGIEAHICVLYTALSILQKGWNAVIATDAVCSRKKHDWETALRSVSRAGAVLYPTETICFMLMERSGTPEFRTLSPLFK